MSNNQKILAAVLALIAAVMGALVEFGGALTPLLGGSGGTGGSSAIAGAPGPRAGAGGAGRGGNGGSASGVGGIAPVSGRGGAGGSVVVDAGAPTSSGMKVGVNGWYLAPSWGFGTPWNTASPSFVDGGNPWNPAFLQDLATFENLRFLEWAGTNYSRVTRWSQRRALADAGNKEVYVDGSTGVVPGLAYEWIFDLCNRTGASCWVTLPVLADDDYLKQFVALAKQRLRTHLIVEISNEVSGGWFRQTADATSAAQKSGLTNCGSDQWRMAECWVVNRTMLIAKEIRTQDVNGGAVACGVASMDILRSALSAQYHGENLEALCMAAYFGNGRDGASYSLAQAKQDIDQLISGEDGVKPYLAMAKGYGLPLYTYEGGLHVLQNAGVFAVKPEAGQAYTYLLDGLNAAGVSLFNQYTESSTWPNSSGSGAWGLKSKIGGPDTSRSSAVKQWVASH